MPSSAYKGTPEGKSAAKKHIKIEIRKDLYLKNRFIHHIFDGKSGLFFRKLFVCFCSALNEAAPFQYNLLYRNANGCFFGRIALFPSDVRAEGFELVDQILIAAVNVFQSRDRSHPLRA